MTADCQSLASGLSGAEMATTESNGAREAYTNLVGKREQTAASVDLLG